MGSNRPRRPVRPPSDAGTRSPYPVDPPAAGGKVRISLKLSGLAKATNYSAGSTAAHGTPRTESARRVSSSSLSTPPSEVSFPSVAQDSDDSISFSSADEATVPGTPAPRRPPGGLTGLGILKGRPDSPAVSNGSTPRIRLKFTQTSSASAASPQVPSVSTPSTAAGASPLGTPTIRLRTNFTTPTVSPASAPFTGESGETKADGDEDKDKPKLKKKKKKRRREKEERRKERERLVSIGDTAPATVDPPAPPVIRLSLNRLPVPVPEPKRPRLDDRSPMHRYHVADSYDGDEHIVITNDEPANAYSGSGTPRSGRSRNASHRSVDLSDAPSEGEFSAGSHDGGGDMGPGYDESEHDDDDDDDNDGGALLQMETDATGTSAIAPEDGRKRPGRKPGRKPSGKPNFPKGYTPIGRNLKLALTKLLDKIVKRDAYAFFLNPVDTEAIPDYLNVIKTPMDFGTMRRKVEGRVYKNIGEFQRDFELVINNAKTYNAPTTLYYRSARKVEEFGTLAIQRMTRRITNAMAKISPEERRRIQTAEAEAAAAIAAEAAAKAAAAEAAANQAATAAVVAGATGSTADTTAASFTVAPIDHHVADIGGPEDEIAFAPGLTPAPMDPGATPAAVVRMDDGEYARHVQDIQTRLAAVLAQQADEDPHVFNQNLRSPAALTGLYQEAMAAAVTSSPSLSRLPSRTGSETPPTPLPSEGTSLIPGVLSPLAMSRSNSYAALPSPLNPCGFVRTRLPSTPLAVGSPALVAGSTPVTATASTKRKARDSWERSVPQTDDGSRDPEALREYYGSGWDWELDQPDTTLFSALLVTDVAPTNKRAKVVEYILSPAGPLDFGGLGEAVPPPVPNALFQQTPARRFVHTTYGDGFGVAYANSQLDFAAGCGPDVADMIHSRLKELTGGTHQVAREVYEAVHDSTRAVGHLPPTLQLASSASVPTFAVASGVDPAATTLTVGPGRILSGGLADSTLAQFPHPTETALGTVTVSRELDRQLRIPLRRTLMRALQTTIASPVDLRDFAEGSVAEFVHAVASALRRTGTSAAAPSTHPKAALSPAAKQLLPNLGSEGDFPTTSLLDNYVALDQYLDLWKHVTDRSNGRGGALPAGTDRHQLARTLQAGLIDLIVRLPTAHMTPASAAALRTFKVMPGGQAKPAAGAAQRRPTNPPPAAQSSDAKPAQRPATIKQEAPAKVTTAAAETPITPVVTTYMEVDRPPPAGTAPAPEGQAEDHPMRQLANLCARSAAVDAAPVNNGPTPTMGSQDPAAAVPVATQTEPPVDATTSTVSGTNAVDSPAPATVASHNPSLDMLASMAETRATVAIADGASSSRPAASATAPACPPPPADEAATGVPGLEFAMVNPTTRSYLDSLSPAALRSVSQSPDILRKLQLLMAIKGNSTASSANNSGSTSPSGVSVHSND